MKIKGIRTSTKPGKWKKGDVIELEPSEKVELAVLDALKKKDDGGKVFCLCYDGFSLSPGMQVQPLGKRKDRKPWAHNSYRAKGKFKYWTTKLDSNKKSKDREASFTIEFKDSTDYLGQPDLEVTLFEMK